MSDSDVMRFLIYVREVRSGCILWDGGGLPKGYGIFHWNGGKVLAHVFAYLAFIGEIPDGLQLDHGCRNPRCVNPFHLEPVTCLVNQARGTGIIARALATTECPSGHALAGENVLLNKRRNGSYSRRCRECHRASDRRRRHHGQIAALRG